MANISHFPRFISAIKSPVASKFWSLVYFCLSYAQHIKYYTKVKWKKVRDDRENSQSIPPVAVLRYAHLAGIEADFSLRFLLEHININPVAHT